MEEDNQETKTEVSGQQSSNKFLIGLVVVVGIGVLGYLLYTRGGYQTPSSLPTTAQKSQQEVTPSQQGEAREITIEGGEFSFSPSSITVNAGEKIRLTFKNVGKAPHNFIIDELGVATKTIPAGGTDTIEFTAEETGTYKFYCSVGSHRQQGMEGELSVE